MSSFAAIDCPFGEPLAYFQTRNDRHVRAVVQANVYGFGRSILATPAVTPPKATRKPPERPVATEPPPKARDFVVRPMRPVPGSVSMAVLMDLISEAYKAPVQRLRSDSSVRLLVWPRQHFMTLAAENGFSTTQIGNFLGRDHTTVMHGITAHRDRVARSQ